MKARLTALLLSLLATTEFATAQDWSGFYGGLSTGKFQGDWELPSSFDAGEFKDTAGFGIFAGYNFQSGNFVYGAEIAASKASDFCYVQYPQECTEDFRDLKARVGFASGRTLIYGVAGITRAQYSDIDEALTGTVIGLGVDYAVSDRLFLGGEVLRRHADIDFPSGETWLINEATSLSLRLGIRF